MDPLFQATPSREQVVQAVAFWPELSGRRIRPLLVTAFGDIFVETDAGEVWLASPIDLKCEPIAQSVAELEKLFADPDWARLRLLTEVALLAKDKGIERPADKVFAIAPHPCFTGSILAGQFVPMDLKVWHSIASQLRLPALPSPTQRTGLPVPARPRAPEMLPFGPRASMRIA